MNPDVTNYIQNINQEWQVEVLQSYCWESLFGKQLIPNAIIMERDFANRATFLGDDMGTILLDMSISLDGYIAGLNGESGRLYDWYFAPESQTNPNGEIIEELERTTGAIVLGRRAYGTGEESGGYEDDPYQVPNFVVTHHAPEQSAVSEEVRRRFVFVTAGVESAVMQAKAAAGDKDVAIGGGADIAQQCLRAGLVDEIQLHLVPILFGDGIRLFDGTGNIELETIRVVVAPDVTHLRFRVLK